MKTLFAILGVALLLVAGGIIAMMSHEKTQLLAQLADSEARIGQSVKEMQGLKMKDKKLNEEITSLNAKLAAAKTAAEAAAKTASTTSSKSSTRGSVKPLPTNDIGRPESTKPMKALSDMMKNPAMREMAKAQQVAMMDMQYGDLFTAFQFNDEEKADFKKLLAERLGIDTDMGMRLMDDTLTPDQRKAVLTEINDAKKQSNDRIREFLNSEDDYKIFDHFENTKGERMQLAMGKSAFASAPLSPQQEQQLVDAMHEATMRPSNVPNLQKPENFDPRKFSQADIDLQMQKYDNDALAVLTSAQKFLSPQQIESLKTMQKSSREMVTASLKMMNSMMGNGGK